MPGASNCVLQLTVLRTMVTALVFMSFLMTKPKEHRVHQAKKNRKKEKENIKSVS